MTRRPVNRSKLIPQQQALVDQQEAREEVLGAVVELLGESVDPEVIDAVDTLNSRFLIP